MITNPYVFRVLDISTGHMTEADSRRLGRSEGPVYELAEYGWLVYIGEMQENWSEVMSPAFMQVLKEAQELKCDYVHFDRDGKTYEELPVFDW